MWTRAGSTAGLGAGPHGKFATLVHVEARWPVGQRPGDALVGLPRPEPRRVGRLARHDAGATCRVRKPCQVQKPGPYLPAIRSSVNDHHNCVEARRIECAAPDGRHDGGPRKRPTERADGRRVAGERWPGPLTAILTAITSRRGRTRPDWTGRPQERSGRRRRGADGCRELQNRWLWVRVPPPVPPPPDHSRPAPAFSDAPFRVCVGIRVGMPPGRHRAPGDGAGQRPPRSHTRRRFPHARSPLT